MPERKPAFRRGTLGGDEYRNFLGEAPFGSPLLKSRRQAAFAPSSIANCVIGRVGADAGLGSTSPDDAVAAAWTSTELRPGARSIAPFDTGSELR
jgi:hypothetical protein